MQVTYLYGLFVLFGIGFGISLLFRYLRLPSVVGFIIGGILLGPYGFGVYSEEWVSLLIEAGAILLLFVAGLELSKVISIVSFSLPVKSAIWQLFLNALGFSLLLGSLIWGLNNIPTVIIMAFILSLSSTALAIRVFQDRGEMETSYGLISTTTLLFQDIATVGFLMLLVIMKEVKGTEESLLKFVLGITLGVGSLAIITFGKNHISKFVGFVALKGGRDLLTLFALFFAIGGAYFALRLGWTPGLGACLAGIMLGQSDEKHLLVAEVQPFQDVIYALFFITLGMCFPVDWAISNVGYIVLSVLAVLFLKFVFNVMALKVGGNSIRVCVLGSVALLPLSEFSFILGREVYRLGFISDYLMNSLVCVTISTMILGSFLFLNMDKINNLVTNLYDKWFGVEEREEVSKETNLVPHVVIIGYGLTGENLAKVLSSTGIPFVVIEMSRELAEKARQYNPVRLIVGDATQSIILGRAGLDSAQAVVIGINDPVACRKIVGQISTRYPNAYILVRTRFASEVDVLRKLGAHQVIPEDFETSIEVVAHVLKRCGIPDNIVEAEVLAIRANGYAMLRGKASDRVGIEEVIKILQQTTTQTYYLGENSSVIGKNLAEIDLRRKTGCSVIAVVRNGKPFPGPAGDFVLQGNDVLVLVGAHAQIESARKILDEKISGEKKSS
ncbi:MAG: cation:proton antiporter [Candidatus Hydrogenedentes bacterium]|nr:cation:proton antiporter [Candidatus Hydrogenedentota bacterium]